MTVASSLDLSYAAVQNTHSLQLLLQAVPDSTRSRSVVSVLTFTASLIPHTHTNVVSDLTVLLTLLSFAQLAKRKV